jgi:hypothetical protein
MLEPNGMAICGICSPSISDGLHGRRDETITTEQHVSARIVLDRRTRSVLPAAEPIPTPPIIRNE